MVGVAESGLPLNIGEQHVIACDFLGPTDFDSLEIGIDSDLLRCTKTLASLPLEFVCTT